MLAGLTDFPIERTAPLCALTVSEALIGAMPSSAAETVLIIVAPCESGA